MSCTTWHYRRMTLLWLLSILLYHQSLHAHVLTSTVSSSVDVLDNHGNDKEAGVNHGATESAVPFDDGVGDKATAPNVSEDEIGNIFTGNDSTASSVTYSGHSQDSSKEGNDTTDLVSDFLDETIGNASAVTGQTSSNSDFNEHNNDKGEIDDDDDTPDIVENTAESVGKKIVFEKAGEKESEKTDQKETDEMSEENATGNGDVINEKGDNHFYYKPVVSYHSEEAFFESEEENEINLLRKESIDMIQKLKTMLESYNPCLLGRSNSSHLNIEADVDENRGIDNPDEDMRVQTLRGIEKELDKLFNNSNRSSCDDGTETDNEGHMQNQGSSSTQNEHKHNNNITDGNGHTHLVPPPTTSIPGLDQSTQANTVTEHVVHYHPYCWHFARFHGNPGNSNVNSYLKNIEINCDKRCKEKDHDNEGNDEKSDGMRKKEDEKIEGSKENKDQGCSKFKVDSENHKLWEGDADDVKDCYKQGSQRPCIDVFSQESVIAQMCSRMNSLENGNKCMTSRLTTNQIKAHNKVTRMEEEMSELKKTIELLQKSSMFYAEAPLGSSQVRGYKVKLSQGEGFEPTSGIFTAPYDGIYQITVGFFKRTTSHSDEVINIMLDSEAIFGLRVEGLDQQRIFMTSLVSGQSLWLTTNVKLKNDSSGVDIDLVFFGAFLMK